MSLSPSQFGQLHKKLMAKPGVEGGFTIDTSTGKSPRSGIGVSYPGTEHMTEPAAATTSSHIEDYAAMHSASLDQPGVLLGGWKPESDEFTTLDRSQVIKSDPKVSRRYGGGVARHEALTSALDLGIARNQFSVYNFKTKKSHPTGACDE